jgi:hypothetical protein
MAVIDRALDILELAPEISDVELAERGGPLHLKAKLHEMIHQQRQAQAVMLRIIECRRQHYGPTHPETTAAELEAKLIEEVPHTKVIASLMTAPPEADIVLCQRCGASKHYVQWQSPHDDTALGENGCTISEAVCESCLVGAASLSMAKTKFASQKHRVCLPLWRRDIDTAKARARARLAKSMAQAHRVTEIENSIG